MIFSYTHLMPFTKDPQTESEYPEDNFDTHVWVDDRFTQQDLIDNFRKNIITLGFHPAHILHHTSISGLQLKVLQNAGLQYVHGGFYDYRNNPTQANQPDLIMVEDIFNDGEYIIQQEDVIKILMFFIGCGLPGFTWKKINIPSFNNTLA